MLGEVPVFTAVRDYLARSRAFEPGVTVARAAEELIALKKQDRVSGQYTASLTGIVKWFSEAFPGEISQVTSVRIERRLREGDQSALTRNNWLKRIKNLFTYAKRRGYLPKNEPTAPEALRPVQEKDIDVGIFTPEAMRRLPEVAAAEIVPLLAIGGFVGLRVAEICRLDWSVVNLERRLIELRAGQAKTASRRNAETAPTSLRNELGRAPSTDEAPPDTLLSSRLPKPAGSGGDRVGDPHPHHRRRPGRRLCCGRSIEALRGVPFHPLGSSPAEGPGSEGGAVLGVASLSVRKTFADRLGKRG